MEEVVHVNCSQTWLSRPDEVRSGSLLESAKGGATLDIAHVGIGLIFPNLDANIDRAATRQLCNRSKAATLNLLREAGGSPRELFS